MLSGILSISFAWFIAFGVFFGIGLIMQRFFGLNHQKSEYVLSAFWVGWCMVILFLQVWHLFLPVELSAGLALAPIGVFGIVWNRKPLLRLFQTGRKHKLIFLLALCLFTLWLANQAMGRIGTTGGDAGRYHVPVINWISLHPIIPGLGNLHDHYALNTSYFLYLALLNVGPKYLAYHLGFGLMLLVLTIQMGLSLSKLALDRSKTQPVDIFLILFFFPIMRYGYYGATTSYDKPLFVLGVVIGAQLCRLLMQKETANDLSFRAFFIALLSAVGITIKLSFVGFGCCASLIALALIFKTRNGHWYVTSNKEWIFIPLIVILVIVPWMVRGIFLSGYILYPSTLGAINVDWKLSEEKTKRLSKTIRAWARKSWGPNEQECYHQILSNWDWVKPWTNRLIHGKYFKYIRITLILCILGLTVTFYNRHFNDSNFKSGLIFLLPGIAALVFWFFTAPDPRFAEIYFWYIGVSSMTMALTRLKWKLYRPTVVILLTVTMFIVIRPVVMSKPAHTFSRFPKPTVKPLIIDSGLTVHVSVGKNLCWEGPLVCTQMESLDKRLQLRTPENVRGGFNITTEKDKNLIPHAE